MIRQGVAYFLKDHYPTASVYEVSGLLEAIKIVKQKKIDLILLDINFPGGTSLSIVPTIRKIQPDIKILIFSAFEEDIYAVRYINSGANGYLSKLCPEDEMHQAIKTLLQQGKYVSVNIQNKILDSYILKKPKNPFEQLSNREIEIAKLLVEGVSNNTISISLNIKSSTVSTYKHRIYEKLGIDSLSALITTFNFYYRGIT